VVHHGRDGDRLLVGWSVDCVLNGKFGDAVTCTVLNTLFGRPTKIMGPFHFEIGSWHMP
jgi:hypothetical protein